jgi:hypothetical protein
MVTATVTRTETVRVQNTPGLLTGGVLLQGSHLGGERFSIGVADSDLAMARAEPQSPNAILDTDPTRSCRFFARNSRSTRRLQPADCSLPGIVDQSSSSIVSFRCRTKQSHGDSLATQPAFVTVQLIKPRMLLPAANRRRGESS